MGLSLAKSQSGKLMVTRKTSEDRADNRTDEPEAEDRNRRTPELTIKGKQFFKSINSKKRFREGSEV